MNGVCVGRESEVSDMRKTITDFIEYAKDNLIWFAFNLVMIFMPLICIFILNPNAENLDIADAEMSYTSLLVVCCIANLVQFALRPRIYTYEKKAQLYEDTTDRRTNVDASSKSEVSPRAGGGSFLGKFGASSTS